MKIAAVIANFALLGAVLFYLASANAIELEPRELPLFGLMFAAPGLSIFALLKKTRDSERLRPTIRTP